MLVNLIMIETIDADKAVPSRTTWRRLLWSANLIA